MNSNDNWELFLPFKLRSICTDLVETLLKLVATNPLAGLSSCSLVTKTIKGKEYLYAQGRLASGRQRQVFVCPRDKGIVLEKKFTKARNDNKEKMDLAILANKALRAMGMQAVPVPYWQILSSLSEGGIFRRGGVLTGDIAYYCNMARLGAKLLPAGAFAEMMHSLDREGISIAFGHKETFPTSPLERLKQGISPFNEFNPFVTGDYNIAIGSGEMVNFMLSLKHVKYSSDEGQPHQLTPEQRVLLDYLIEDPQPAVILGRRPLLVTVPQPAHQVIYSIINSQSPGLNHQRVEKELRQAYTLMQLIKKKNPSEIGGAKNSARARNPEWSNLINSGLQMIDNAILA